MFDGGIMGPIVPLWTLVAGYSAFILLFWWFWGWRMRGTGMYLPVCITSAGLWGIGIWMLGLSLGVALAGGLWILAMSIALFSFYTRPRKKLEE